MVRHYKYNIIYYNIKMKNIDGDNSIIYKYNNVLYKN